MVAWLLGSTSTRGQCKCSKFTSKFQRQFQAVANRTMVEEIMTMYHHRKRQHSIWWWSAFLQKVPSFLFLSSCLCLWLVARELYCATLSQRFPVVLLRLLHFGYASARSLKTYQNMHEMNTEDEQKAPSVCDCVFIVKHNEPLLCFVRSPRKYRWTPSQLPGLLTTLQTDSLLDWKIVSEKVNSTRVPQGTVLSPFLLTPYTSDVQYSSESFHLQKYSDNSAIVGCIMMEKRRYTGNWLTTLWYVVGTITSS